MDWEPSRTTLDPMLNNWGFAELGREKRTGGMLVVNTTDDHGASLELADHGTLTITGVRVSDTNCS